ncbi:MAG: hypothetical protein P1U86_18690 [Verrucomicrobiales bacterium]|nr:hypothetical protein [Verrucomicrobiales bacterium]
MLAEGKVAKVVTGFCHAAIVEVDVEPSPTTEISTHCSGEGWIRQGSLEDATADGYTSWKDGAESGVRFALAHIGRTARVRIERVTGMITDTNATCCAVAAARAVWNGLGYSAPDEIDDKLHASLVGSFDSPDEVAPIFRNETQ